MRMGTYHRLQILRGLGFADVRGRVLDIGGFDGGWVATLRDVDAHVIDVNVRPLYQDIAYMRGDGQRLPFKDAIFDAVFAIDVIEHVPDEERLVGEALRVLRPGGRLILTTPNETIQIFPGALQPWVNKRWGHDRVPGFSAAHVESLLKRHSVSDLRVRPIAMSAYRSVYFPLTVLWRLPGPFGRWLSDAATAWDAGHLEGDRGSILAEGLKPPA